MGMPHVSCSRLARRQEPSADEQIVGRHAQRAVREKAIGCHLRATAERATDESMLVATRPRTARW